MNKSETYLDGKEFCKKACNIMDSATAKSMKSGEYIKRINQKLQDIAFAEKQYEVQSEAKAHRDKQAIRKNIYRKIGDAAKVKMSL